MKKLFLVLLVSVLGMGILEVHAEKVVTVIVCGNRTGYYVEEQHQYGEDWSIHTLSCSAGEDDPCRWANNPNTIVNFHNSIPTGVTFYDDNGNVAEVNVDAVNNAINSSIDNGYNSATIVVNNITLNYSISAVTGQPGYDQIVVNLWVTN